MSEHLPILRRPGTLAVLGACTLWLLIQNSLLLLAAPWRNPPDALVVVLALARAGLVILGRFWVPAALVLLGGILIGYVYDWLRSTTEAAHDGPAT